MVSRRTSEAELSESRCNNLTNYDSLLSLRNGDRGLPVDKAAQFLCITGRNPEAERRRRLISRGIERIRNRIDGVAGMAQANPARAHLILARTEANAFAIFPSHHFG